jgi:hypothetical protein
MVGDGTDRKEIDRELARYRGELAVLREEALARLRALFERGGKSLH